MRGSSILLLEIGWSRCIVCFACPAFRGGHNDVADRIFHVIVAIEILGMKTGESFLDPRVGSADTWVGAQVIAEEQSVALIGPACLADMEVGAPLARWCAEVQFAPFFGSVRASWRQVIAGDVVLEAVAQGRDRSHQRPCVQRRDRDLHIDDIFGRAQGRPEAPELQRPLRIVRGNDDEILHAYSPFASC
jgi:hypothetical protein